MIAMTIQKVVSVKMTKTNQLPTSKHFVRHIKIETSDGYFTLSLIADKKTKLKIV